MPARPGRGLVRTDSGVLYSGNLLDSSTNTKYIFRIKFTRRDKSLVYVLIGCGCEYLTVYVAFLKSLVFICDMGFFQYLG